VVIGGGGETGKGGYSGYSGEAKLFL